MPWSNHPGPVPRRSEADLLALTRAKASALSERRRRESAGGILVAVVLLAGIAAVVTRHGGDPGVEVKTASDGQPARTSVAPATTAGPPDATTTPAPAVLPFPPPPTAAPVRSTTTTSDPPPTTSAPGTPTSTTTTRVIVFCEIRDYAVRVFTDKSVYDRGEQVRAAIEVTNNSGRACFTNGSHGAGPFWRDAAGELVAGGRSIPGCIDETLCGQELAPGATASSTWCWNQEVVDRQPAPPGTYTADLAYHGAEGRSTFQLSGRASLSSTSSLPPGGVMC